MSLIGSKRLMAVVAVAICFSSALAVEGATIFVKADATGANNGSSWTDAFTQVQPALNAAVSNDEVWVAAGTYVENITLTLSVALYGGFAGNEDPATFPLASRDFRAHQTILDGNQAGSVVTSPSGATNTTRIDGFTIRNGTGTLSGSSRCGGGIYCRNSSPTIINNTIRRNAAVSEPNGYGGGIHCSSSSPLIANNVIIANGARYGGGIYCLSSSPTIMNNTIVANSGEYSGGIYCVSCPSLTIANNIIAFNSSGIYKTGSGTLTLQYNCVFGNTSYNYSGVTDPTGTNGNISADPKLAEGACDGIHIQPDSPCKDAGDDDVVQAGWLDIDGQMRIQGSHVDIGADESDGTVWPACPSVIVRVSPEGDDAHDGSSWLLAKRTVQAGIDAASVLGGQVWVRSGTYVENITLKLDAALYGGFAGGETSLVERDWATNKTILDGNQAGSVVTSPSGITSTTRIDGFTIRNGRGTLSGSYRYGGGIYCRYSSPTIVNNTVRGNTAVADAGGYGGGIYCQGGYPIIANNTIIANGARYGGGIYCVSPSATIANNTIVANSGGYGGGIYCPGSASALTITNTIVAFNSSGVETTGSGTPTLRCNCVYGNTAYDYSGVTDPTGSNGNISSDPKMAGVAYGNMHIQPDSPCKDTGDDAVVRGDWLDMDGQPRTIGAHVDIGADESDGTASPAGPYVIVRVKPNGSDANDGSSWDLAKQTVQAGIDAAAFLGGEVWVGAGTYCERISVPPFVYLYGGFVGAENAAGERNWAARPTILEGLQGGSVVTFGAGYRLSAIDGFTIRNGRSQYGGGISCRFSSPMITNNTISDNRAFLHGGGIYCSSSSPLIANNTITGDSADDGSGICCDGDSAPTIANNMITSNSAQHGGGIYCSNDSSPMIANNTITGNSAADGGGIFFDSPPAMIANNIVAFNSSGLYHAGLDTPILRSNCVYGNTAYNYSRIADPTGTSGNISADPKLAGVAYGNMHSQPDSPCRDAGDDAVVQADWLDIDGQARIRGGHVDIGADESDETVWAAGPYVIVRVSPQGDDAYDGSSWTLAKRTVQAGVDAASALGGEVWVRAGTYPERITLPPFVYLYGGFVGTENAAGERSWAVNPTILDGEQGGPVVTAKAGFHLSTIDGFTIRNGKGTGGIDCFDGSPTIANNTITGNSATAGGGIYCRSCSSPIIANNTIAGNLAAYGGGIHSSGGSPIIVNNTITGNTAYHTYGEGGGIGCFSGFPMIANNTITGNVGNLGGGIHCRWSSPTIANNTIAFNSSGIYQESGSGTPVLRYNCVFGNTAYNFSGITDPTGADGNISLDPLFVQTGSPGPDGQWGTADDDYGDLRLQAGSPCIDAGSNADVPLDTLDLDGDGNVTEPIPFDLGGHARFVDSLATPDCQWAPGTCGTAPIVDMGAYEMDNPPEPDVLFVNDDATGANNGTSWIDAYTSLQAALDQATARPQRQWPIWVAAGTYRPSKQSDRWYPRSVTFTLANNVSILGGFVGNEDPATFDLANRDFAADESVLSGDLNGDDGPGLTNNGENADHVVTANGVGPQAVLDGFTVSAGNASAGAGLYNYSASPTLRNCTFRANAAATGAGIYITAASNPTIIQCGFEGNLASTSGGGLYSDADCSPSVTDCSFDGNSAGSSGGGGAYLAGGSRLRNCSFSGNAARIGGGLQVTGSTAGVIDACTFTGNQASVHGGGIFSSASVLTLIRCLLTANSAPRAGGMGLSSTPVVVDCFLVGNLGTQYGGGGIVVFGNSAPTLVNCTIAGNWGATGSGGVLGYAGVMSPRIINCVLWGNVATGVSTEAAQIGAGAPTIDHTCVEGWSGSLGGTGNIGADPLFVRNAGPGADSVWGTADDDYGDLRLLPGSPCIDASSNAAVPADALDLDGDGNITEPIPFDLAGHARFLDDPATPDCPWAPGTCGTAPIVDMGAYEFIAEASPDMDGDGDVDVDDFELFLAAFGHRAGQQGYNVMADLDGDGAVTFVDYQQWLQAYRAGSDNPQAPAPLQVLGDFGLDGHVDATDLEHLQACTTGPGVPQSNEACQNADLDRDGDIDQADFGSLQRCLSGPEMVDLGCKY